MLESALASQITVILFMSLSGAAALSDIAYYKIPNVLVVAILALYPEYVLVNPTPVDWLPAVGVAVVALAVGFGLFATNIFGAGDVKLAVVTLLWAGPALALPVVLITSLVGGVMAVIMMSRIRFGIAKVLNTIGQHTLGDAFLAKDMPYGVAIATGGLFVGWFLLTGA